MSIISQETFNKFTEEEKAKVRELWDVNGKYCKAEYNITLEELFGKENLQPKPKIKTWKDVEEIKDSYKNMVSYLLNFSNDVKLNKKLAATFQIKLLIEHGYGGLIEAEEWKQIETIPCILWDNIKNIWVFGYSRYRKFISFHNKEQAEEFMSYPENVKLIKEYYMI